MGWRLGRSSAAAAATLTVLAASSAALATRLQGQAFDLLFLNAGIMSGRGVALTDIPDDDIEVLLNNGNGTFAAPRVIDLGNFFDSSCVTLADFNADGLLDMAVGMEANRRQALVDGLATTMMALIRDVQLAGYGYGPAAAITDSPGTVAAGPRGSCITPARGIPAP